MYSLSSLLSCVSYLYNLQYSQCLLDLIHNNFHLLLDDLPAAESSPEREARHLIKKIRRQVRLLNRKWAEVNQGSNEWQVRVEEVIEVCSDNNFESPDYHNFFLVDTCIY